MAGKDLDTTLRFKADITDFDAALKEANAAVKRSNAEFKNVTSTMDKWSDSTDGLRAKITSLEKVYQAEEHKLQALRVEYDRVAKEQGENSEAAEKLKTALIEQEAKVNKTETEWKKYRKQLENLEDTSKNVASKTKEAGEAAKKAGGDARDGADGWSIMKDVLADFISNAVQGAIDALANLAEETREYRRDMAQMAQNAADAGHSMSEMKDTLKDVASVTGETDAAMEGLNMLMATGLDTTNLTKAAEAFAGAATKFDGLKFEGMAEGLQETLAVGEAIGPFAELIERMGGDLEAFNAGMAACTTEAERQQYAMQWLNESGLQQVHDSYVQNNADLVEAEQAQFRHNEALAGLGAAIEPISTALTNLGTIILEQITPVVENIIQWVIDNGPLIEPIITGIAVALGVLAAALAIQGIINGVSKAFALLNTTMRANPILLIVSLLAGLVAAFVSAYKTNETFRNKVNEVWAAVKNGIGSAISWVGKKFDEFVGWCKALPGKISSGISGAISAIVTWGQNLASKGREAAANLVSSVVDSVTSLPGKLVSIGANLVQGLWDGISNSYQWIKDKISGWVGNVMDFIKGLFGIHSPSTVMRDEVGKMLGLGMAEGIADSRNAVNGAVRRLGDAALGGLSAAGGGASVSAAPGRAINFTQNNYSPHALTRREIYRQTNNLLAFAGGVK